MAERAVVVAGDEGDSRRDRRQARLQTRQVLRWDRASGDVRERVAQDLLSQLELAKTRERTVQGTHEKVRQGKIIVPRRPNYGFTPNRARDQYEIDHEKAAVIRRIFREVGSEGRSLYSVTNALNCDGVPSPWGGR